MMLGSASAMSLVVTFPPLRFKVIPPKEVTPDRFGSTVLLPCSSESEKNENYLDKGWQVFSSC